MELLKKVFNNVWAVIAGAFAIVVGFLLFERSKKKDAEAKLENAETKGKSDVIDANLKNNVIQIDSLSKANEQAKEETKKDTKEDLADFLKKR